MYKSLTDRECEVLKLLTEGKSNEEIAEELSIGNCTVKAHLLSIFGKLSVNNRTQAAIIAIKEKWFED